MKKLEIRKSFKSNKFKYGGYATLITTMVLLILLIANLVVDKMDLKFDMTKNKLFSLSEQSYKVMDGLSKDINIISFNKQGSENQEIAEILNKYHSNTKKITIETIDPSTNPQIAKKYSSTKNAIRTGSIVVESGSKFKVIDGNELYNMANDENTGQSSVQSIAAEQKITGAIMYVVSDKNSVVYNLEGHNEKPLADGISNALSNQNFVVKTLNLLINDWKPAAGDMLLVSSPSADITKDELIKLKDFFSKGGHGLFVMDVQKSKFPNFDELMSTFGIQIHQAIVLEGDSEQFYKEPMYLIPKMNSHAIIDPMVSAKLPILFPLAQPIEQLKVKKASLKIEPLLTTSSRSWGKKNIESSKTEKEVGDLEGPFDVAVAITDTQESNPAKIVVFSSAGFINVAGGGNLDLFMNSMNWVQDLKENISIAPKDVTTEGLQITKSQALGYSALVVIIIPSIILIAGVLVWLRRRHL
ncbi:GldG family protein [Clostridium bowmanii]|uniref:Gldg family protein n=1 Tax=Clostridium bowmanii TaxID=132925 RepID=UPI001C0BEB22|nr:Gldg family protein [Clostridium bowmanii]MBU3191039.1 GldG family protein [Clostridium bowmanii]MCA1075363.1 GldG family protein [Clostridium bowmanii]